MLRAIVVGKVTGLSDIDVVATLVNTKSLAVDLAKQNPDMVILDKKNAQSLFATKSVARSAVVASTHQGMQLIPIANVYYFQADHKYVIAHHTQGQLLIEDTLNSLEQEFADDFVRIHRKTLIACKHIEALNKDAQGQYMLKMRGVDKEFSVSRRQLPKVRKILLCL